MAGGYDDAFALSRQAARELGWYCRNTAMNPFTVEGKKTVSFEICEQLTRAVGPSTSAPWRAPDRIYVSVGDGNIITGVHKGLKDLEALGWIDAMPAIVGVQAEGSAAIANAFAAGATDVSPVKAHSVADSIVADRPADGRRRRRLPQSRHGVGGRHRPRGLCPRPGVAATRRGAGRLPRHARFGRDRGRLRPVSAHLRRIKCL